MALKCTINVDNNPAYYNHNNPPGILYSFKSFKCTFVDTNHQANDVPKTRALEKM